MELLIILVFLGNYKLWLTLFGSLTNFCFYRGIGSLGSLGSGVIRWSFEACKKEALKYNTRKDFRKNSGGAYRRAWKNKWLDDFFPKNN